jgi:hypothetical protein
LICCGSPSRNVSKIYFTSTSSVSHSCCPPVTTSTLAARAYRVETGVVALRDQIDDGIAIVVAAGVIIVVRIRKEDIAAAGAAAALIRPVVVIKEGMMRSSSGRRRRGIGRTGGPRFAVEQRIEHPRGGRDHRVDDAGHRLGGTGCRLHRGEHRELRCAGGDGLDSFLQLACSRHFGL